MSNCQENEAFIQSGAGRRAKPISSEGRFPSLFFYRIIVLAACVIFTCSLRGESTNTLKFVWPFPSTVAAAKAHHFPSIGFDPPIETNVLETGDSGTILATLFEKGGRRTQWLIHLKVVAPTEREKSAKLDSPQVIYTTLGHKLVFPSSRAFANVLTIGPFVEDAPNRKPPAVEVGSARVALNTGFLGLGFDRAAVAGHRIGKLGDEANIERMLSIGQKPFSKSEIAKGQEYQAIAKLTDQEERAIAGVAPALQGYFGLAMETPQLSKILFKVFDAPSVWSLLKHGRMPSVLIAVAITDATTEDPRVWHLPESEAVYRFPWAVIVNDHPSLEIGAIVTAPHPPFLLTGGVIGLLASDPKDKEKYLTLYLVSARRANVGIKTSPFTETIQSFAAEPSDDKSVNTNSPFDRIALIGASVTHGFTASEPFGGKNTARYNLARYLDAAIELPHGVITNLGNSFFFMQPNTSGEEQIKRANSAEPTLVVGIDFLFWFCYGRGFDEAGRLKHFDEGLELLDAIKCPLILGDIPDASAAVNGMLSPEEMPSAQTLVAANRRLKEWTASRPRVVVVPLSRFMTTVMANQELATHGVTIPAGKTRELIQDDKLHPSGRGCAALALAILDAFQAHEKGFPDAVVSWDADKVFRRAMEKLDKDKTQTPPTQ